MTIQERIQGALACDLLTVEQLALIAQYHPMVIYRKVDRGEIPGVERTGPSRRWIRFRREIVIPWSRQALYHRDRRPAF